MEHMRMQTLSVGVLSATMVLGAAFVGTPALARTLTVVQQEQVVTAAATTGELHVIALEPDGLRAANARFEMSAQGKLFRQSNTVSAVICPQVHPWSERRITEAAVDGSAAFADILPGIPFQVRAVDGLGREFGGVACSGLQAGETRSLEIPILVRRDLTIRVQDDAGQPVADARVFILCGVTSSRAPLPFAWEATTDEQGECSVDEPIAPGPLGLIVLKSGWIGPSAGLTEMPGPGEALVVCMQPIPPVPDAAARRRIFPQWSAEIDMLAARADVTAAPTTHAVITVSWDESLANLIGEPDVLRLKGDTLRVHRITEEERTRRSFDLAMPLGQETLCLAGESFGVTPVELPIDVREPGRIRVAFRAR